MRVITLAGDHYEMGLQHGRQTLDLRPRLVQVIEQRIAGLEGTPVAGLLPELERRWAVIARPTLDMLAGMARALDLDPSRFLCYAAASYLEDSARSNLPLGERDVWEGAPAEGCTVWAASGEATADRMPILAKNRDYNLAHLDLQVLARATPRDGYRYMYVASAGSVGVSSSGMNEAGLTVADTRVASSDVGPGLARYTLMMELLERHDSVRSALRYLRRVPQMGGGNLILADAQGSMAAFESGYQHWGVIYAEDRLVAATNHFVTPALRGCRLGPSSGATDGESPSRLRSIRARLRESRGRLDAGSAALIMAAHADGRAAICRHAPEGGSGTISAVVFFPAERRLRLCAGRPCEGAYTQHSL